MAYGVLMVSAVMVYTVLPSIPGRGIPFLPDSRLTLHCWVHTFSLSVTLSYSTQWTQDTVSCKNHLLRTKLTRQTTWMQLRRRMVVIGPTKVGFNVNTSYSYADAT
jgi:hypothetical protein